MPDVFILGFTKCATTSLYNQLQQHPDVSQTKRKEPHYHFARVMGDRFAGPADNDTVSQMFVTDKSHYEALYEPGKLAIDGSAMSIEHPRVLEAIHRHYPNAKYLVMLRDPVERAFSAYSHLVRDARETRTFYQALEHELSGARADYLPIWKNIQSSRFVDATQFARHLFGDRLMVVNYRDYAKSNQTVMDAVATFIGLTPIPWRRDMANRSGVPHSKAFQKILMRQSLAKSLFVRLFPQSFVTGLKRTLMERNTGSKPAFSQYDRDYLQQLLSAEHKRILPGTPDTDILREMYPL